jgi:hypothetical protein
MAVKSASSISGMLTTSNVKGSIMNHPHQREPFDGMPKVGCLGFVIFFALLFFLLWRF